MKLFVNILKPDKMYSVSVKEFLTQPIQIQLSQNKKTFAQFLSSFSEFTKIWQYFGKNMSVRGYLVLKL